MTDRRTIDYRPAVSVDHAAETETLQEGGREEAADTGVTQCRTSWRHACLARRSDQHKEHGGRQQAAY